MFEIARPLRPFSLFDLFDLFDPLDLFDPFDLKVVQISYIISTPLFDLPLNHFLVVAINPH